MRIGIVAYWFNRGQAVVARQIRATLDGLGHETHILARPTRKTNIKPGWVDTEGVWAQERVTAASDYLIPGDEYLAWAESTEVVFYGMAIAMAIACVVALARIPKGKAPDAEILE